MTHQSLSLRARASARSIFTALPLLTGAAAAVPLSAQAPPGDSVLAITGVNIVDVRRGVVVPEQTVLIRGGRIDRVGAAAAVALPAGMTRIDGRGRYLLPGLIDMHTHPRPEDFPLYLAAGVTTVRVMAGGQESLRLRAEVRDGARLGPGLIVGGPIIESPPPAGYEGVIVTAGRRMVRTAAEGAGEVERQRAAGFDFIKIYNHLSADGFTGVMRAARALGMDVVGHVPFAVGIDAALAAGMRTVEHGRGYLHLLLPPEINDSTGPDLRSRILAWRHADTLRIAEVARMTAAAGAWNCPTFVIDRTLWPSSRVAAYLSGPYRPWLGAGWRRNLMDRGRIPWASNFTEADFLAADHAADIKRRIVRALSDAGAPLCAGSDAWPPAGFSLHEELRLLVDAGLTPLEALRAATSSAAEALRRRDLGHVGEGARADLVLLDADPLANIEALARPHGVMVAGRWLSRAALDSLLDVTAAGHRRWLLAAGNDSTEGPRALRMGTMPALSPDGGTLFFLDENPGEERVISRPQDPGRRHLYLTSRLLAVPTDRPESTPVVVAVGVTADAYEPAYDLSPDGRSVVYAGFTSDSTPALIRVPAAGGAPRVLSRLADGRVVMPRWSPDGRSIAFALREGLFILPAEGGTPRRLSSLPAWDAEVKWSPDGSHVAALGGTHPDSANTLYLVRVSTGEARRITPEVEDRHYKEGIRWHPDGRHISYMCYCGEDQVRIASVDSATTRVLVDLPDRWDWYGAWSPDGDKFLFRSYGDRSQLWELDVRSGSTRFVGPAEELPVWSADGRRMVWSR